MNILSISSRVTYGHVGHAASVFCLQRLGHEVWPVETTLLSNHLGYPAWGGRQLATEEVAMVLDGLERLGVYGSVDVYATGFLGKAPQLAVETLGKLRRQRPDMLYALDPVMGERQGGLYVPAETAALIKRELLAEADLTFPNIFELDYLSGSRVETLEDAIKACAAIRAQGRPDLTVIATGIERVDGNPQAIETMAVGPQGVFLATARRHALKAHGTGDCFAALFLGHYLKNERNLEASLGIAASAMAAVVEATGDAMELALVAAQDAFANPPKKAVLQRLG
ncbi:pyridoxal kinase PdxY [Hypericibacter adhaerens]|jgi:pyridoxine kinase|uniref:pyridoxal kinase n=1 Tax=Hypericibacter adhaerens TaxID=2602016 RepID=A0A5J6N5V0_9PROT|nr:pyridoxal kinase [Hypericibacter adhaerens]QEX24784.1 pyridoxal kinase PdxY [Hypericibacter adhaerens]